MKKNFFLFTLFSTVSVFAQEINYSPAYFGPNANPVPEFTDARIASKTNLQLAEDFFFGFGDNTINTKFVVEIPLLPENVSMKLWLTTLEAYKVSNEVAEKRNMQTGKNTGTANGDIYVQTRIRILSEKEYAPNIVLNSTLKTASAKPNDFKGRRYFDTPGYYFDVEIGKSIYIKNNILNEIRGVANLGFLCWETTNSRQNDAPMYGGKIILSNHFLNWENSLSGYWGWIRNGDNPLIYSSKIKYKTKKINYIVMYQYGIKDFPYHHIQAGISIELDKLTPNYK